MSCTDIVRARTERDENRTQQSSKARCAEKVYVFLFNVSDQGHYGLEGHVFVLDDNRDWENER